MFTMLPAPKGAGLQVLNRQNFKWIELHKQEGYNHADRPIILNTGRYSQVICACALVKTRGPIEHPLAYSLTFFRTLIISHSLTFFRT
jgi:hypothetical protein